MKLLFDQNLSHKLVQALADIYPDFHQRSFVWGHPPKVIWLKLGNCSTEMVENILRKHVDSVRQFDSVDTASFLILS